jgi:hypothetical protein
MSALGKAAGGLATLALALVLSIVPSTRAEVQVSVEPSMTRGPVGAPVTILEFSDYQ